MRLHRTLLPMALTAALLPLAASTPANAASFGAASSSCKIKDSRIKELSGLAASVRHKNILWANNDSGDKNRIYAIDANTCAVKAVVTLAGAGYYDYESIAMGRNSAGKPVIWVGDTGDNSRARKNIKLYRLDEPTVLKNQTVPVRPVTVTWSNGRKDSEAMYVEPKPGGRVFLVSKEKSGGIYQLRGDFRRTGVAWTGARIASTLGTVTDAAVSPNNARTVIRNYSKKALLLKGVPGSSGKTLPIPAQPQGEAIAFSADSKYVYVASEGSGNPLWKIYVG